VLSLLEPPRPRRVARSPRAAQLVVATVCIGAFMGQLDASITSVALHRLATGFGVGVGGAEWVSLTYVLVLVALVAPIGAVADAIGRKSLYVGGFAVFTVASATAAVAPDLGLLCAARAVQAVGAALLQANSVALIAAATPREKLGRAVGVQAAAQAVGLGAGPAIGGALLSLGSWRLLFLVNVPFGVVGVVTGAMLLPRSRDLAPIRQVDPRGVVAFIPMVGLALAALSLAADQGRLRLVAIPVAAAALGTGTLLARHRRRTPHPLIDRELTMLLGVRRCLAAGFFGYAALFGTLVVVPLFAAADGLTDPARIGLELAALPVGIGLVAPVAGRWSDRRPVMVARGGLLLAAIALAVLAALRPVGVDLVVVLAALGAGLGAFTPANNRSMMAAASPNAAGAASGLLNMARGLGTAAGTAIAVVAFTSVSSGSGAVGAAGAGNGLSVTAAALAGCCLLASAAIRPARRLDTG
jgi:MFS family permease